MKIIFPFKYQKQFFKNQLRYPAVLFQYFTQKMIKKGKNTEKPQILSPAIQLLWGLEKFRQAFQKITIFEI